MARPQSLLTPAGVLLRAPIREGPDWGKEAHALGRPGRAELRRFASSDSLPEGFALPSASPGQAPAPAVVLECVYIAGADVAQMPPAHRCRTLPSGSGGCIIGRAHQPDFFSRLVPDEAQCNFISRNHCALSWGTSPRPAFFVRRLTSNMLLVDSQPVPDSSLLAVLPGATITLGGPLGAAPLLVLKVCYEVVEPQPLNSLPAAPAVQAQAPPSPAAEYVLTCTAAVGRDLGRVPVSERSIAAPLDKPLQVGRQHQVGFFDRLLGSDSPYVICISRTHFELAAFEFLDGEPRTWRLLNHSGNPIRSTQGSFGRGDQGLVQPPITLELLGARAPDEAPIPILAMTLSAAAGGGGPGPAPAPVPTMEVPRSLPQMRVPSPAALTCTFSLGCDVARLAADAKRILLPAGEALFTIGRAHQPGFFEALLGSGDERLWFISRSHFTLRPDPALPGVFELANLSGNPLLVDGARVAQGEWAKASIASTLDFVVEPVPPDSSPPTVFLRLSLDPPVGFSHRTSRRGGS